MPHGERDFPTSDTAEEGNGHGEPKADFASGQVDRKVILERCEETFRLAETVRRVLMAGAEYVRPWHQSSKRKSLYVSRASGAD